MSNLEKIIITETGREVTRTNTDRGRLISLLVHIFPHKYMNLERTDADTVKVSNKGESLESIIAENESSKN